jgi:hypothetical protein
MLASRKVLTLEISSEFFKPASHLPFAVRMKTVPNKRRGYEALNQLTANVSGVRATQ